MKLWKAVLMALGAAVVSAAISAHGQEQPIAGDKRGNRCFNGRYWKDCGTPDVPLVPVSVPSGNLRWESQMCLANECIADTLNSLPFDRAAEAKITTWHNYTYVWFRQ